MKKRKENVNEEDGWVSKSAKKRASTALQELGEELCDIHYQYIAQMGLNPELEEALKDYGSMKSREAGRRQRQLIGKLMREIDLKEFKDTLEHCLSGQNIPSAILAKLLDQLKIVEKTS